MAAAVVVLVGGTVAVRSLAGPGGLPAPEVLAHDPVPAERVFSEVARSCGVTAKTLDALTPGAPRDGDDGAGACTWTSEEDDKHGEHVLRVDLDLLNAPSTGQENSPVAAAMRQYTSAVYESKGNIRPLSGLGDEAVLVGKPGHDVVFRTGNVLAKVSYSSVSTAGVSEKAASGKSFEDGALRAAADVARGFGASGRPAVSAPAGPASATTPKDGCALVPKGLRDRLLGTKSDGDNESGTPGSDDADSPLRSVGCSWEHEGRKLEITITTGTATEPGRALRDISREYLRSHYEARAEPPVSARDPHYFRALKGLGDQGFGAYVPHQYTAAHGSQGPAKVVVRIGGRLVTVEYDSTAGAYDDNEPLTMTEAVNGAYAAARPIVRAVRH